MPLKSRQQGPVTIVEVEGRLDASNYSAFENEATALVATGGKVLAFDCTKLTYVSSAGLRAMLALRKRTHSSGQRMTLCGLQPAVLNVFEISGFTKLFDLHRTVDEVLA